MGHPLFSLDGTTALVTGAGSPGGIGFATARLLVELGCAVAVCATGARIEERARELRSFGGPVSAHVGDLTDPDEARRVVEEAIGAHGPSTCSSTTPAWPRRAAPSASRRSPSSTSPSGERACVGASTRASSSPASLPTMLARGSGAIVNVASVTGPLVATPGESAYAAAKAAMVGLTRTLALEVADRGVTVNAVAPGWVATDSQLPEERAASVASPMGRAARPDEVAAVVAFLAMPGARYVHGATIVVDGANHLVEMLR